jgi:archaemetzincin
VQFVLKNHHKKMNHSATILFALLLAACNQPRPPAPKSATSIPMPAAVQLLPYQGFDTGLLADLRKQVAAFYHCPVKVLPPIKPPAMAWYEPRQRYKADSLLVFQKALAPPHTKLVGLMYYDISTRNGSNPDWGVFGLGYCPGPTSVASTCRLQNASRTKQQLQQRLAKVVLHELGHNFGMPHCTGNEPTCLMNDAKGTMTQVDKEELWICGTCLGKIKNE